MREIPPENRSDGLSGGMIIRANIFSKFPELRCGMSTRHGGVSPDPYGMNLSFSVGDEERNVVANRRRFFGSLDIRMESLAVPRQVHGDAVRFARTPGIYDVCDGLVTNAPGVFLTVTVADCLPVFLFDPATRSLGAVHTGWRGSRLRVVEKAVREMTSSFGTRPADLLVFVGPSAGHCCYEVGDEVANEFPEEFLGRPNGARTHLDLRKFNQSLLLAAGVPKASIEIPDNCTICSPQWLHSYRREGGKSGRMMGVIGLVRSNF